MRFLMAMVLVFGLILNVQATDFKKVLRVAFEASDDGFDMVKTASLYSARVAEAIFEPLLTYDYMANPVRLRPLTVQDLPKVSLNGLRYIFKIRPGIFFSPDEAFKGKRRELVAEDYIYSYKRILDPANRSPLRSFLAGKIAGLDELAASTKKKAYYDEPVAGLFSPDKYTLIIDLNLPDENFLYVLANVGLAAVAREVIEFYGQDDRSHPVGTGAYQLTKYVPNRKILLTKNPNYRGFIWNYEAPIQSNDPLGDNRLIETMSEKKMPRIDVVEIDIIEEGQSTWLAFESGQLDYVKVPSIALAKVIKNGKLQPQYERKGIQLVRDIEPNISYTVFNMEDPLVGGFSREKIALRRAIGLAYELTTEINLVRHSQAQVAQMLIPPGIEGFDPSYQSSIKYDPDLANRLLDEFNYKRGPDGWRNQPDGKPLALKMNSESDGSSIVIKEIWRRSMKKIGLRIEFQLSSFQNNMRAARACQFMMWNSAWLADYPDGENFLQLFYGPNVRSGNNACYSSKNYDRSYREALILPKGEARRSKYAILNRQLEAHMPLVLGMVRFSNWLVHPKVQGFHRHPFLNAQWQYLDIAL